MPRPKKIYTAEDFIVNPTEKAVELSGRLDDRIDQLSTKVDQLVEVVNALTNRVLNSEKKEPSQEVKKEKQPVEEPMPTDDVPVPPSWIKKMQEILGNDFIMKIIESAGGDFVMDVYLPEYLKREKQIKGPDHSTGLIRRPSAIQDVETWCIKIRDNIKKYHPEFKN